jgi:hypothetical protein
MLAVLVGAASFFHPDVDGSDLWWHLAAGRAISQIHGIPLSDPFSHTAGGEPWTDHSWLWGALFYAAYDGHPDAAAWLNLALLVATFALVAASARRASGSWLAAGAATWLTAASCHWYLDVRPHVITLLFTALLLATLRGRRAPWLWPPLLALWVNLHGGFLFGLGLIGLHALLESIRAATHREPLPRAIWVGVGLAALAVGLNPWGYSIYSVPFEPLDHATPFRKLIEWQALLPSLDLSSYAGRFGWLAVLAAIGALRARRAPFPIALALVTAAMALAARRFVPLFAISAAPLAAQGVALLLDTARRRSATPSRAWQQLAASAAGLAVGVWLWHGVDFEPRPLWRWTTGDAYPSGAVAFLRAMPDPPRHLFNFYDWGGYLMLNAPNIPVFIDGRAGTVYSDTVGRDYFRLIETRKGWRQTLAARDIDAVLVPKGAALALALRRQRPAWRVAHLDPRSVLLLRPAKYARSDPEAIWRRVPMSADVELARGLHARMGGDLEGAETAYLAARRMDPLQYSIYAELMLIEAQRQDAAGVRRWIDEALRVYPRRWNQIWGAAEHAYGSMGACAARLDALRKLRIGGPFDPDDLLAEIHARIDALETPGEASKLGCKDRGAPATS